MSDFIKKLVEAEENETDGDDEEEDVPIEFYEIEELAKRRVLLKNSIRIHGIIFILITSLTFIIDIFTRTPPINSIFELWAMWPTIFWGFGLIMHLLIVITDKINSISTRAYIITAVGLIYLGILLFVVNHLTLHYLTEPVYWSWWTTISILGVLVIYTYFQFYYYRKHYPIDKTVENEIEVMKKEYLREIEKLDNVLAKKHAKDTEKGKIDVKNM